MPDPIYSAELNREVDIDAIVDLIVKKVMELDYDIQNSQIIELNFEGIFFEIEVIKNPDYIDVFKVWMSTEEIEQFEETEGLIKTELLSPLDAFLRSEKQLFEQARMILSDRQF